MVVVVVVGKAWTSLVVTCGFGIPILGRHGGGPGEREGEGFCGKNNR